jgi:hypothetical protein
LWCNEIADSPSPKKSIHTRYWTITKLFVVYNHEKIHTYIHKKKCVLSTNLIVCIYVLINIDTFLWYVFREKKTWSFETVYSPWYIVFVHFIYHYLHLTDVQLEPFEGHFLGVDIHVSILYNNVLLSWDFALTYERFSLTFKLNSCIVCIYAWRWASE